ncbi:DEAD/DEAH box helicase family protein [Lactobacillus sp. R2/2]|nr:DEAD/DEAH box helicase family protein [Lactobacillus sp. R2/2]
MDYPFKNEALKQDTYKGAINYLDINYPSPICTHEGSPSEQFQSVIRSMFEEAKRWFMTKHKVRKLNMYELRTYQSDLIQCITKSMQNGHHHIIVQSPPRTGKTVVMAEIARRTTAKNNRVMFIIHRKEVLEQAKATFKAQGVNPNLATMGLVQTLCRRVDKLPEPQLILIDEGHHALAKSYQKILNKFKNAYVLFFTATPRRTRQKQLDQIADDIIVGKSIKELTNEGF